MVVNGLILCFEYGVSNKNPAVVIGVTRANESARPGCGKVATKVHSSAVSSA